MFYIRKLKRTNNQLQLIDFAQGTYTKNDLEKDIKKHLDEFIKNIGFILVVVRENYLLESPSHNLPHWCENTRKNIRVIRTDINKNLKLKSISPLLIDKILNNIDDSLFEKQAIKKQTYEIKKYGVKTGNMEKLNFSLDKNEKLRIKQIIKLLLMGKEKEAEDLFYDELYIYDPNEKHPIFTKK